MLIKNWLSGLRTGRNRARGTTHRIRAYKGQSTTPAADVQVLESRVMLSATTGNDVLNGTGANETIDGLAGDDTINGGGGNDTLSGSEGDDTLSGENGKDTLNGGPDNDTLLGGSGDDTLNGDEGNDTLVGGTGTDTLDGGEGSDTYVYKQGDGEDVYADSGTGVDDEDVLDASGDAGFGGANLIELGPNFDESNGIEKIVGQDDGDKSKILGDGQNENWDFSTVELVNISAIKTEGGNDTVVGSDGDDQIEGGNGEDDLSGGEGNDTLLGGSGNDTLNGDDGDDTLVGGTGTDKLDGGEGSDTYVYKQGDGEDVYADSGTGVDDEDVLDASGDAGFGGANLIELGPEFDESNGIEKIIGQDDGDKSKIVGDGQNENWDFSTVELVDISAIKTSGGNDTVVGSDGDDRIEGENGQDDLSGGEGNDTLLGGSGDDTLNGDDGDDTLVGGTGTDTLDGGEGSDTYVYKMGDGEDVYADSGEEGFDVLDASAANHIELGPNFDESNGIEQIVGQDDRDKSKILGDGQNENWDFSTVELVDITTVRTEGGNDTVVTSSDSNTKTTYDGGNGKDEITIDLSAEQFANVVVGDQLDELEDYTADPEDETLDLDSAGIAVTDFETATAQVTIEDTTFELEDLEFIGTFIVGTDGDDQLGNDDYTVVGSDPVVNKDNTPGNDLIIAKDGNDFVAGGNGNDIVSGGEGDDTISGGDGSDIVFGGDGNDTINGGLKNDELFGNDGDDTFVYNAGGGVDTYDGGEGDDTISVEGTGRLTLGETFGPEDSVENIVSDTEETEIVGGTLTANDWDFSATTLGPNITEINAGRGNDTVVGSDGDDTINGGGGEDNLSGGLGNDTLNGGDKDDVIDGGEGDDTINGGIWNDDLSGGAGNDTFVYNAGGGVDEYDGGTGKDTISVEGTDRLVLGDSFGPENSVEKIESDTEGTEIVGTTLAANDWDFSATHFGENVTEVNTGRANDSVVTSTKHAEVVAYDGGNHEDTVTVNLTPEQLAAIVDAGRLEELQDYTDGTAEQQAGVDLDLSVEANMTLDNFENTAAAVTVDGETIVLDEFSTIDNVILGTPKADTLEGTNDNDLIFGLNGNDTIDGKKGADIIFAGAGNDTVNAGFQELLQDQVDGGAGNKDTLVNDSGFNMFLDSFGGEDAQITGFEVIDANGQQIKSTNPDGADLDFTGVKLVDVSEVSLGSGDDTVVASNKTNMTYNLGGGDNTFTGANKVDTVITGSGADTIDTGNGNDVVTLNGGADDVDLGAGNDKVFVGHDDLLDVVSLDGGAGNKDTIVNDSGFNLFLDSFGGEDAAITGFEVIDGNGQQIKSTNPDGADLDFTGVKLVDVSEVSLGSGDDTVVASNKTNMTYNLGGGDNTFTGANKVDTVITGSGADTIDTGNGNDVVTLNGGADDVDLGAGNDTVFVGHDDLLDVVSLDGGAGNKDTLVNDSNFNLFLDSFGGEDATIIGFEVIDGNGQEIRSTDAGSDFDFTGVKLVNVSEVNLGNGDDTVVASNKTNMTYDLGNGTNEFTGANKVDTVIGGNGVDTIDAGKGNDVIDGGAGNDVLDGGDGNDVITGGAGDDTMTGGAGKDRFVIAKGDGNDSILDFDQAGNDVIQLLDFAFTAFDQLSFTQNGGNTEIDLGGGQTLTLVNHDADDLSSSDFLFS